MLFQRLFIYLCLSFNMLFFLPKLDFPMIHAMEMPIKMGHATHLKNAFKKVAQVRGAVPRVMEFAVHVCKLLLNSCQIQSGQIRKI